MEVIDFIQGCVFCLVLEWYYFNLMVFVDEVYVKVVDDFRKVLEGQIYD